MFHPGICEFFFLSLRVGDFQQNRLATGKTILHVKHTRTSVQKQMPTKIAVLPLRILAAIFLTGSSLLVGTDSTCTPNATLSILQEFYNATNGASWINPWNMSSATNPCLHLVGINCSASSCVTTINLTQRGLSGSLPPTLGALTSLKVFDIRGNHLSGTLPLEYANWTSLTAFVANNNSITGTLPPEYSAWGSLSVLAVNDNIMSGTLPRTFGSWTSLSAFLASNNNFSGTLPSEYSNWIHVSHFTVAANNISGSLPASYGAWTRIWELHVNRNIISGTLPPEYEVWSAIAYFSAFDNRLTGTLPSQYSLWSAIIEFSVQSNSLTETIPQYAAWTHVQLVSLSHNFLIGTLPSQWPKLKTFLASHNRLSGAIPSGLVRFKIFDVFSVGYNNLSGSLPSINCQMLDVQNNSQLTGNFDNAMQPLIVAICGTLVSCPTNKITLCIPPEVLIPFAFNEAISIVTSYNSSCVSATTPAPTPNATIIPPLPLASLTITTPLPSYIVTPNVPSAYVPSFTPPAAFVAAISIVEPTGGVGLIALGASRCAPTAMKSSTSPGRVLLSPFYTLGSSISVLGNVGMALSIVLLHYTSVRLLTWKKRQIEVSHKRGKHQSLSSNIANDIMSTVRFPHISFLCVVHLAKGVAFHGGQSLLSSTTPITTDGDVDESTTDTEDALALSTIAASMAALALISLVISVVQVERRGVASKLLHFQTFRQAALHRIRWLPPWTLPTGMWCPEAARRRIGALRGPIRNGCEHFAMLWSVVSVLSSLTTGVVPGSAGGCIGLAVVQTVILGGACLVVVVFRPMRTPLGGWLVCATWVVEVCISLSLAVARSMNHTEAPVEATVVLSTLHTIIGVLRFAHRGALWWWERGLKPNDMTPAANCSPLTCNLTNSVNSDNRRLAKNEKKHNKDNRGSRITLCQVMALSEGDHANQTTHILSLGDSSLCGQHGDVNEVAVRLSTLITMCCERRAVGSVRY